MDSKTIGVNLAKNVFVACVDDGWGQTIDTCEFNRRAFPSLAGDPAWRRARLSRWKRAAARTPGATRWQGWISSRG